MSPITGDLTEAWRAFSTTAEPLVIALRCVRVRVRNVCDGSLAKYRSVV